MPLLCKSAQARRSHGMHPVRPSRRARMSLFARVHLRVRVFRLCVGACHVRVHTHTHARTHLRNASRSTNSEWRTAEEALLSIVRVWPITYLEPLCRLRACARDGALFTPQSASHTVRCVGRTEPPHTARTCTRCDAYNARCNSGRSTLCKACGARSALYGRRPSNRSTYQCFVMLRDACFACIIARCG